MQHNNLRAGYDLHSFTRATPLLASSAGVMSCRDGQVTDCRL